MRLGKEIGKGGEATVYEVAGQPGLAVKVYHYPSAARAAKLRAMLHNVPEDPMSKHGHCSIAWPRQVVTQNGIARGFVMPLVRHMHPILEFYNPLSRLKRWPLINYRYLVTAAQNLASAVNALHLKGLVIGDVNESNILVSDTALVTLVDTDSFQVPEATGGTLHRCTVGKPEFAAPEVLARLKAGCEFRDFDRTPHSDCFALGVLIFQLLMEGVHPFDGIVNCPGDPPLHDERISQGLFPYAVRPRGIQPRPLAPPFQMLHPRLCRLFRECFEAGHNQPSARPSAHAWQEALREAAGALRECAANPNHVYDCELRACPWCERARIIRVDSFPSPSEAAIVSAALSGPAARRQVVVPPAPPTPQTPPRPLPVAWPVPAGPPLRVRGPKWGGRVAAAVVLFILAAMAVAEWAGRAEKAQPGSPVPSGGKIAEKQQPSSPLRDGKTGSGEVASTPAVVPPKVVLKKAALPVAAGVVAPIPQSSPTSLDLPNGLKLDLVLIPAGKFTMGSPDSEAGRSNDEGPQHEVTIGKPFYMAKYTVTQELYQAIMGSNPSQFKGPKNPVEQVSWNDAQAFCRKASQLTGRTVRLPTEAEWEYACRAGTKTRFHSGDADGDLAGVGWYFSNSGNTTHPVGEKKPNAWGLYDMHGNVWQWCQDWYGAYGGGAAVDPQGVADGAIRVLRGGSWFDGPWCCRSAGRLGFGPEGRGYFFGFRVAAAVPWTP